MFLAVNLTVLGRNYSLYTHVHHTYGLNDAFDRSVAHLLSEQLARHTDSNIDVLLDESVQQKPLDQTDTAVGASDRARSIREQSDLLHEHSAVSAVKQRDLLVHARKQEAKDGRQVQQPRGALCGRRSLLQEKMTVEHPCLHEGYAKDYMWMAHGAHVAPLPQVQLLGR